MSKTPILCVIVVFILSTGVGALDKSTHVTVVERSADYRVHFGRSYRGAQMTENGLISNMDGVECIRSCRMDLVMPEDDVIPVPNCKAVNYAWFSGRCERLKSGISQGGEERTMNEIRIIHIDLQLQDSHLISSSSTSQTSQTPPNAGHVTIKGQSFAVFAGAHYVYPGHGICNIPDISARLCIQYCSEQPTCKAVNFQWLNGLCELLASGIGHIGNGIRTENAAFMHILIN